VYGVYIYAVNMAERKEQIVRAALDIADDRGLAAVSMRAVAARVGVTAMALYRHVGSKEELLDGVLELLLAELPLPDADESWESRLRALGSAVRELARRHPATVRLVLERPGDTPDARVRVAAIHQALRDAGLRGYQVERMERLVSTFAVGFAISEVSGRFSGGAPADLDREFSRDIADLIDLVRRQADAR
jgi:AcrR family transcriptional regulator